LAWLTTFRDDRDDIIGSLPLSNQELAAAPTTIPQKKDDAFITPTSFKC